MNVVVSDIDVKESVLRRTGDLLDVLLIDRTTKNNILWATDSYEDRGEEFAPNQEMKTELVTGVYNMLIQPRAAKSLEEQRRRTREKAEVFTPLKTVEQMNKSLETYRVTKSNWQTFVKEIRLEITCGEGPFIVSRYNPTAQTGQLIKLENRVGFLDRKLQIVSKYCDDKKEWLKWAKKAYKASYGYEWQGDNVLIARENLLYTFIDFYEAKFERKPALKIKEEIAEIISWNIFQMDGLRYVVPMSCFHEIEAIPGQYKLFGEQKEELEGIEEFECEGCVYNRPHKHNGRYVKVMDWENKKIIKFVDLIIRFS